MFYVLSWGKKYKKFWQTQYFKIFVLIKEFFVACFSAQKSTDGARFLINILKFIQNKLNLRRKCTAFKATENLKALKL